MLSSDDDQVGPSAVAPSPILQMPSSFLDMIKLQLKSQLKSGFVEMQDKLQASQLLARLYKYPRNKRWAQMLQAADLLLQKGGEESIKDCRRLIQIMVEAIQRYDELGDITKLEKSLKKAVKEHLPAHAADLLKLLKVPDNNIRSSRAPRQNNRPRSQYSQLQAAGPPMRYAPAPAQYAPAPAQYSTTPAPASVPTATATGPRLTQAAVTIQHVGMDKDHCVYCTAAGQAVPSRCHFLKKNPTAQTIVLS